jgi:hypothetical protein
MAFFDREGQLASDTQSLRSKSRLTEIGGKYVDWFDGQKGAIRRPVDAARPASVPQSPEPSPLARTIVPAKLVIPPSSKLTTPEEVAKRTLSALTEAGDEMHGVIASRLPEGHRMDMAILAQLLKGSPVLGTCRIGRVPLYSEGDLTTFVEFYVTNFDTRLSTAGDHFYNYDRNAVSRGAVFYGVGMICDRYGHRLRFDRRVGNDGIYYQTKSEAAALYAIAGLSSNKSRDQLMELDRNNFKGFKSPTG